MTQLLISLPEIASLAKVQRPVVSMWRTRFASGGAAFPAPVDSGSGKDLFDAVEVAHWLSATKHGNNPEVVADLAAFSAPQHWDGADPKHVETLAALIALRACDGIAIAEGSLTERARDADPTDEFLRSEVTSRDQSIDWRGFVDRFIDAAYSPQGAWDRLDARAKIEARLGTVGPLDSERKSLLARLVLALGGPDHIAIVDAPGELAAHELIAATVIGAGEEHEIAVHLPQDTRARQVRRHLVVLGLGHVVSEGAPSSSVPAVQLARLFGRDPMRELEALEELVVDLSDAQYALVIGPAAVLVDQLVGASEQSRDAMLRSGRVRAIGRLGDGWVPTATRLPLAFWVIGAAQHDVPIADRFSVIGDLSDADLTPPRMDDLIGDVLAGLGGAPAARRHSFRYLRVVRTSVLVAGGSLVTASVAASGSAHGIDTAALPAVIDEVLRDLGDEAPQMTLKPAGVADATSARPPITVGRAISAREVQLLSGARLRREDTASVDGFPVLGLAELGRVATGQLAIGQVTLAQAEPSQTRRHWAAPDMRRIDRLRLLADYPRAELTQPGDVVFTAGAHPRALVDHLGSSVVEYPARVLRSRSDLLAPELIAADINRQLPHSSWRDWHLRRIVPDERAGLSEAIAAISSERQTVLRRLASLNLLEQLVLSAVASGAATVGAPYERAAGSGSTAAAHSPGNPAVPTIHTVSKKC